MESFLHYVHGKMLVYAITAVSRDQSSSSCGSRYSRSVLLSVVLLGALLIAFPVFGQDQTPDWQAQVRKYSEVTDWESAMRIVEQEATRAPQDIDVRAWRARVLAWSGHVPEAEKEYLEILKVSRNDPDNWTGLANVYLREGRTAEALR